MPADLAGNEDVKAYIEKFPGRGAVGDRNSKPLSVADSLKTFTVPDDLVLETVLAEPIVQQPVQISFDARGRMWVVQYLQYPFPAGLKVIKYDEHLRAVFDKTPLPPPQGEKGRDKITIHEDTDGDGQYDKHKTFVDGLNIATSCAVGRGGVWVLNPPYLLFYPDKNQDDVPDSDPIVHLEGFGLEDTHAVANSLTWGPDGWLYGATGSTTHSYVMRPGLDRKPTHFKGQAIWRYQPVEKRFEIFAEGGGNTFCIEFDKEGRLFSGHNGGNTRGFHYVQGGYYQKSWGKHGELTNPYAFGFFPQMKHDGMNERFSHCFVIYEGGALGPKYEGKVFAPVPLHNYVALSEIQPDGSTFKTRDIDKVITSTDQWFRPVDIKAGPDGAIYIADWYDTRLTHVDPRDTWDRERGRIYRVRKKDTKPSAARDLSQLKASELAKTYTESNNKQIRFAALEQLAGEQVGLADLAPILAQPSVNRTWIMSRVRPNIWNESPPPKNIDRPSDAFVEREWLIRVIGDTQRETRWSSAWASAFATLATIEKDVHLRSQLASTAKRLPGKQGLPILKNLALRDEDAKDPHIPLLIWWGIESKATSDRELVLELFNSPESYQHPILRDTVMGRLAQRYAAEPTPENLQALAKLLERAPGDAEKKLLLAGINAAFAGQSISGLPPELAKAMLAASSADPQSPATIALKLRLGDDDAHAYVLKYVQNDAEQVKTQRIAYLALLGEVGKPEAAPVLLDVALSSQWHSVRRAALTALQRFQSPELGQRLVAGYGRLPTDQEVRPTAIDVLAARKTWSIALVDAIAAKTIPASDVAPEVIERLRLHGDAHIDELLPKLFGRTRTTPEEKQLEIAKVRKLLMASSGDALAGKELFTKTCAKCHTLFNEGGKIGPDLTGYERTNLDFLLLSVLDPSAAIREEFTTFQVQTDDGLVLAGFITERGEKTITMQTGDKGQVILAKEQIEDGPRAIATSLMPERQLADYTDQQIRDLFAYLQRKAPVKK
ncbi:MAG TPA: PVC-type heme-binding CxxCH protein [Pirellulaceae bacterium]|nr:PVC-type heme-binding CxxCH protein [Pirellulaceae bacterium]